MQQQPALFGTRLNKTEIFVLLSIVLLKILSPVFLIHPVYELHRDEFLHLDQAKHLAWGYASVPPLSSWIAVVIQALGNGEYWVKLFPALFGGLTIITVWMIIKVLGGGWFSRLLAATALLLSVLLRMNILFQPNSLDILAWTLVYFCLVCFLKTRNNRWIYWMAACFAFGLLNKYSIGFLGISLAIGIAATPQRWIFKTKHLYFAGLFAVAVVLPNFLWQARNGFPVVHHMQELAETQLANINRGDFVKEQVLFFINSIFILIAAFIAFIAHPPFRPYRSVLWSYVICMGLLIYFKSKGYYAIGLYPVLIAFGAIYLEHVTRLRRRLIWRIACTGVNILLFIPFLLAFPILKPEGIKEKNELYAATGMLRWEDGKDHDLPQDFADMQGWKEMATKAAAAYRSLPQNEHTLIRTDNYGQAGAINYYAGLSAVSYNADYLNWFNLEKPIVNMILVKEVMDEDADRSYEKPYFEQVYLADSVINKNAREYGTRIYVLRNATIPVNDILHKEIQDIKNKMRFDHE